MRYVLIIFLIAHLIPVHLFGQSTACRHGSMLIKTVKAFHYQELPVDAELSARAFKAFVENLDPLGLLFSIEDSMFLAPYRNQMLQKIEQGDCKFYEKASTLYHRKLIQVDTLLKSLKNEAIDLTEKDQIELYEEEPWRTQRDILKRWKQYVKLRVLSYLVAHRDTSDAKTGISEKLLSEAQQKVLDKLICRNQQKIVKAKAENSQLQKAFLEAIASSFDPHTTYFSPDSKNEFENMLSKESLSFGMEFFINRSGEIEISTVLPGGPAWNSNQINEGDIIEEIQSENFEIPDLACASTEEIMAVVGASDLQEANFRLRKKSGKVKQIRLKKAKIDTEENIIQSYLLGDTKNIGYIRLPSFYTDFEEDEFSTEGCANDVAKELIKLKREGVEGLILDLRDNGGGSMYEAIKMAGIFINYGAVAIAQDNTGQLTTLKDQDRGMVFTKPLIVLVNKFSASASELFAGAMQDQNRGVIVGGTTYGKSTMQTVFPIEAYKYGYNMSEAQFASSEAFLKITIGAFYRVTGKSHQREGIIPDIMFPDLYDQEDWGEKGYASALSFNPVEKKVYYYPGKALPIEELGVLSEQRLESRPAFAEQKTMGDQLAAQYKAYTVPLAYQAFNKFWKESPMIQGFSSKLPEEDEKISVHNPSYLEGISSLRDENKLLFANTMAEISADMYIQEAYHIINDWIEIKHK